MSEPEGAGADVASQDGWLGNRLVLRQPRRGHRAGTDAVLLAAAAIPLPGELVCDLGAGTGAVGLIVAARHGARVVLAERDPALVALARENIAVNGLGDRVEAVCVDLLRPAAERHRAGLAAGAAGLVLTNPPYLEAGRSRASPDPARAAAHTLPGGALARWLSASADALAPKGRLALIHRADHLDRCLAALARAFGGLVIRPVLPRADAVAMRIVILARRGSRAPLALHPPLVLHETDGRFTPEAERLHRGEGQLFPDAVHTPKRRAGTF